MLIIKVAGWNSNWSITTASDYFNLSDFSLFIGSFCNEKPELITQTFSTVIFILQCKGKKIKLCIILLYKPILLSSAYCLCCKMWYCTVDKWGAVALTLLLLL